MNKIQSTDSQVFRQMAQTTDDEIDLSALARTLWRGKIIIILCAIVAVLIGGWYAYVAATPVYTSSATVALESRQEQVVDIESVVTGLSGDQATINTEVEVIRSRGLIEKLVNRLNLVDDPEFNATLRPEPMVSIGTVVNLIRSFVSSVEVPVEEASPRAELDAVIDAVLADISVSNIRQSYVFRITATTRESRQIGPHREYPRPTLYS